IDPNGVVYGAIQRAPVAGASLTLLSAGGGIALPSSCFDDPAQQGQVTRSDGYYKFDLNFSSPSCPSGGDYVISVAPPGSGYVAGDSQIIPPLSSAATLPLSVPACPGGANDALPATAQHCEAQTSEFAPPIAVPAQTAGTRYHMHLTLDNSQVPGSSQIFNNHIPLDPELNSAIGIIKTTPLVNVSVGQLVPYEITLINGLAANLPDLSIVDRYPAGFRYVEGSARIDGKPTEPTINGRQLTWSNLVVQGSDRRTVVLLLAVGAGVTEGEFTNRAQAVSSLSGVPLTGEARATVRVVPDPNFACTDVLGKVFDDTDRNGYQDEGEGGLSGIRLVTARGLVATTDAYGRYHITCAVTPHEGRGNNFVLKLDDRTLPTGYRMSTRQVQVKRATRGKALRFNFGASINRVVSLDLADAVFEPDSAQMRTQWESRFGLLLSELEKAPSRLRLAYVADVEDESLVERRLSAVKRVIIEQWKELGHTPLTIESEVFWRLGSPPEQSAVDKLDSSPWEVLTSTFTRARDVIEIDPGTSVERHLPSDASFTQWAQDPARLAAEHGDTLEQREVLTDVPETVKLKNVVPAIRFGSGTVDIPTSTIETLRVVLEGMRHLENVRLHLSGHSDNQPLSGTLAQIYRDNEGLSRERSGEVAEFIQSALALPPDAISYGWAGDREPVATNATEAGRAKNRRVEVEVWYDEMRKKLSVEDVVVSEEIKRVKVCRMETVCKLRFREGHARRARVKNLIAPLRYEDETVNVSEEFFVQVGRAMDNLRDKQNVTVSFIGYTDDVPLSGRTKRIYGTHLAVSKARAHRVALTVKEALNLPSSAVASDGRGATRPVASNDVALGRALNRRIEVEFWYDDPLQELPDEPQVCPGAADAEMISQVYDPAWGRIAPIPLEGGEALVPPGYLDDLRRALSDMAGKTNARLRFVGYTSNERLDRRTAVVYGDDIGLSAARARRTMEKIQAELGLADSQVEHEGRGYLYSNDVVNGGFIQGDTSQVAVEVVYDEAAVLDEFDGVAITPITRELSPKSPLELNLMRISVDGEPIDDPGRSYADIQRCTDVALEQADVQFRFDALRSDRRLSVTAASGAVQVPGAEGEGAAAASASFRMYTNYPHFIERSEIRIFDQDESVRAEPLSVIEVGPGGMAQWQPPAEQFASPKRELKFVLRAYDGNGHFDETAPQSLWIVRGSLMPTLPFAGGSDGDAASVSPGESERPDESALLAGYGESGPLLENIPIDSAGSITVHGSGVPPLHTVWVAGNPVPVDEHGEFVAEAILPSGMHTVEVNVLDESGNGELFLRDLELKQNDWFYVGIADVTLSQNKTNGSADALSGENSSYDTDSWADGRLAFYLTGKFAEDWKLTASADTREDSIEDLFSNFMDKSPESLFRRIDPDYHYPTFGDDGTVEEMAPTLGKFFVKVNKKESHALWGNFEVSYLENELALVERGLYGGNVHYQSEATTSFGEQRVMLDGFAADPGTVSSRDEFRGTGGSLYYLRHQDLLNGSDRMRIELRDKDSGLVTGVVELRQGLDYDIDYLQGRILLSEPMTSTVADELLVRSDGLSGYEAWLVAQYEYTPGFDEIDTLATGGQGHYWFGDFLKLGLTANRNDEDGTDSSLYAADLTLRKSADSWLKVQAGRTEGQVSTSLRSDDGGFGFVGIEDPVLEDTDAYGYRADLSIGFADVFAGARGQLNLYAQLLDAGYTAPGLTTLSDTEQFGGLLRMPIIGGLGLTAKADTRHEDEGLETLAVEVDVDYQLTDRWNLSAGVRHEEREDNSPIVPLTQEEGDRTDVVAQVGYDSNSTWSSYAFAQGTVASTGDREDNTRGGVGGEVMVTERLSVDGEVSHGDLGTATQVGSNFQKSEQTNVYVNYTFDNERGTDGVHRRQGNLVGGTNSRISDSASVFAENRYQHSKSETGLTRAVGMSLAPTERWNLGGNVEHGTLKDKRTSAETERVAAGASVSYSFDSVVISSGIEFRYDDTEQTDGTSEDRTTWLFRNSLKYQISPDWRLLGKFNHSFSESSEGNFFDADYTEAVLGYAYRPVENDRLNALIKYTYFYNFPTADQANAANSSSSQFIQKSHIASLDAMYDVTRNWSLGGKYAYRLGQVSLDR
ncbi:MAG: OmpA family protein, partial [Deltaproteobacteria bacterium]|nr:OmpA family protein [Deltaproteobacteria bacterium]